MLMNFSPEERLFRENIFIRELRTADGIQNLGM